MDGAVEISIQTNETSIFSAQYFNEGKHDDALKEIDEVQAFSADVQASGHA